MKPLSAAKTTRRDLLYQFAFGAAAFGASAAILRKASAFSNFVADLAPTATSWASYRATPDQRGVAGCKLSDQPALKWEFASPDGWIAGVAIVGEHVYAPALAGFVHCINLETGKEVWKYRSIDDPDPKKFAAGFKAAPLVTASTVYIGDEDGVLHAIDRATGTKRWIFATGAEIAGCVAQFGEHLLLASHDSNLYCLTTDGKEVWKFATNDRINCSPGISDTFTFVAGCDEHLRVIDLKEGKEFRDIPLDSPLIGSPAVVGDLLYVGTHTGQIVCANWRKGEFLWKYDAPRKQPFHASAAVTDSLVIVGGHDKNVHAVDRETGKAKWMFPTRARVECSGAVVDDRVFIGSGDGNLYGISLTTGLEVWKFNAGKGISAGVAIGEGYMIVGEDQQSGRLLCFH